MDFIERKEPAVFHHVRFEDRSFYIALGVSLMIHIGLIVYFSSQNINVLKRPLKQVEVTYQVIEKKRINLPKDEGKIIKAIKEDTRPKKVEILTKDHQELPFFDKAFKDISKLSDHFRFHQKQSPQIRTLDVSRNISIPVLKSEKINNPKYLSYNQNIRRRIKQQAYRYVENPQFRAGEVYLTFILDSNGVLKDLQIIESRSRANEFLKNAGLRSIKDANPFPPFPKDLNYPELTFNVVISFEVNE